MTNGLKEGVKEDAPVVFIDIENCTNFQLPGDPTDYAAIYIACYIDHYYTILTQVKGLQHSYIHRFLEKGEDKADDVICFLVKQAAARFKGRDFILFSNDKGLISRFYSICHKHGIKGRNKAFYFYADFVGLVRNELSKSKKKNRPDNIIELTFFIQNIFDDIEVYHLSPALMRRRLQEDGLIDVVDNFVTYNF